MVGSVLVGAYDRAGNFIYCGRIMSGFSDRIRRDLAIRLSEIGCVTAPFQPRPVDRDRVHWVTPLLVGRVEYREYTSQLRHARGRESRRSIRLPRIYRSRCKPAGQYRRAHNSRLGPSSRRDRCCWTRRNRSAFCSAL
jgi:ATP-dependent DNA ligase